MTTRPALVATPSWCGGSPMGVLSAPPLFTATLLGALLTVPCPSPAVRLDPAREAGQRSSHLAADGAPRDCGDEGAREAHVNCTHGRLSSPRPCREPRRRILRAGYDRGAHGRVLCCARKAAGGLLWPRKRRERGGAVQMHQRPRPRNGLQGAPLSETALMWALLRCRTQTDVPADTLRRSRASGAAAARISQNKRPV